MRRAASLPPEFSTIPFSVRESAAAGVSRRRTRARDLLAPYPGVRVPIGAREGGAIEAYAPRLRDGQVFSHDTAARIWGLPLPVRPGAPIHVAARGSTREPRVRGVVGHRLGDDISTDIVRGLPVVAACDAWCQLAECWPIDEVIAAGDRLIGWPEPLARADEIDAAMGRFGGRRGAVVLRRARSELRPGSASARETRLRLAVIRAGYPEPECNGEVDALGMSTHGDLVFRPWKVILEYDGEQHRLDERQFQRDVDRLNALALAGWIVIRVNRRTTQVAALGLLRAALRDRGWSQ